MNNKMINKEKIIELTNKYDDCIIEEFLNVADKYDFHIHGAFCH